MPNPCQCCKKSCPNDTCQCKCGANCDCGSNCKCCPKQEESKGCCGKSGQAKA